MPTLAFLTQHGKLAAVQAPLRLAGYETHLVDGFDTDTLGTFTGETARSGNQLEAATAKAKMAARLAGVRFGLGSEGSFGPDPHVGLSPWGRELLVWWDAQAQRAVFAVVQGPQTNYAQVTVSNLQQAQDFATQVGFPAHGIIVGKPGEIVFSKNCDTLARLVQQVEQGLHAGPLWLETDMRAHRNPTRMGQIAQCAQQLASLLQRHCPACNAPGFGEETPIAGAVCESCALPTAALRAKRVQCNACGHAQVIELQASVPASRCERCNP